MAPNYSITQKGKRNVIIRTQSQDEWHVSMILTKIAICGKLPPYLIFKGKPNGKINRELNNIYVKAKKFLLIVMQMFGVPRILCIFGLIAFRENI